MDFPDRKAPADFPHLHDIGHFNERLMAAIARVNKIRPYTLESIGSVGDHDIFLLSPAMLNDAKPRILSAGGFHGEEPAGPWGILEYLETATEDELKSVNHSFLPLVNPTGFVAGTRLNIFGENPNRGFVPELLEKEMEATGSNMAGPSVEGGILMSHLDRLLALSRDGFVTQHEDSDLHAGFLFINEKEAQPSAFSKPLLEALSRHVGILQDGGADTLRTPELKNGIWHNDIDGSFEGLLTLKGIPRAATTETPGMKPARARIDSNRDITRAFVEYARKIKLTHPL